jgi:hypothetical protein
MANINVLRPTEVIGSVLTATALIAGGLAISSLAGAGFNEGYIPFEDNEWEVATEEEKKIN